MSDRTAKDVVAEMFERQRAGDGTYLDELVTADMVNHAAGPGGGGLIRVCVSSIAVLESLELTRTKTAATQHETSLVPAGAAELGATTLRDWLSRR